MSIKKGERSRLPPVALEEAKDRVSQLERTVHKLCDQLDPEQRLAESTSARMLAEQLRKVMLEVIEKAE